MELAASLRCSGRSCLYFEWGEEHIDDAERARLAQVALQTLKHLAEAHDGAASGFRRDHAGWLVVDVGAVRPDVPSNTSLQFQLNGGPVHEAGWQYEHRPTAAWLATSFSIPVVVSELVEGPNSIRLFSSSLSSVTPYFANADIVVR